MDTVTLATVGSIFFLSLSLFIFFWLGNGGLLQVVNKHSKYYQDEGKAVQNGELCLVGGRKRDGGREGERERERWKRYEGDKEQQCTNVLLYLVMEDKDTKQQCVEVCSEQREVDH